MEAPQGAPTLELLNETIVAHQLAVPFENLDIVGRCENVPLETEAVFDKVVNRHRGGYCFELNGLFCRLLEETGFNVTAVLGRGQRNVGYTTPVQHRATVVEINGERFFCDVGYGGVMAPCALPLVDGAIRAARGQGFRVDDAGRGWWRISYLGRADAEGGDNGTAWEEREPEPVLAILDTPMAPSDFAVLSYYCSTCPDSPLVKRLMINRRTEDGNVSINGDQFVRATAEGKETVDIATPEQLEDILSKEFGIVR